jgi:hypothetical protein
MAPRDSDISDDGERRSGEYAPSQSFSSFTKLILPSTATQGTIFGVPFISMPEPFKDTSRGSSARQSSKAVERATTAFDGWYEARVNLKDTKQSGGATTDAKQRVETAWQGLVDPYNALLNESGAWDGFAKVVNDKHEIDEDMLSNIIMRVVV